jgi:recombination protein RecA
LSVPNKKEKKAKIEVITPESLRKQLNERWPDSTRMGSDPSLRITRLPTGILSVDTILGGGFARGRHAELYGPFGAAKSCVSLRAIAECQRQGGLAAYVDAEHTFDPRWAKHLGVKTKKLDLHVQESGETCIDYMQTLLMAGLHDIVVLDSIAALLPTSERSASSEDGTYGTHQARLMSRAMRKLTTVNKKTVIIFINQTREAIGIVFGNKMVTSGGRAMGFYAGVRLDFTIIESLSANGKTIDLKSGNEKDAKRAVGHRVMVTVAKDKTGGARQRDTTTFVYDYDLGNIDPIEDLIFVGRMAEVVHKSGDNWWVEGYRDEQKHGRPKFKKWLQKNAVVQEDLADMINKSGIAERNKISG